MLGGVAQAASSSASDAMFLARVGVGQFGTALAVSSAVLIVVLGFLGAAADRYSRRRLLILVATAAAFIHAGLAMAASLSPVIASSAAVVLTKQAAAAFDLLLFVLAAERFDARENRTLVPIFVFAGGLGMVIGSLGTSALVFVVGAPAILGLASGAMAIAAVVASGLAQRHEAVVGVRAPLRPSRTWHGIIAKPLAALRERPLARHLGVLVALGGTFAPILYFALGAAATQRFANEAELTSFFGVYRAVLQVLVVAFQFAIAPVVLRRAGIGLALVLTPVGAVLASLMVGIGDGLWAIVVAQGLMRALDAAVATPAEKLAQNLLPRAVRGRVAGALDGLAKRSGAILGGALASAIAAQAGLLAAAASAVALAWVVAALGLARRFAALAVRELTGTAERDRRELVEDLHQLGHGRLGQRLRPDLIAGSAVAIELVERFDHQGELDGLAALLEAHGSADTDVKPVLRDAVVRVLRRRVDGGRAHGEALQAEVTRWICDDTATPEARARALLAVFAAEPATAITLVDACGWAQGDACGEGKVVVPRLLAVVAELVSADDSEHLAAPGQDGAVAQVDRPLRNELIAEFRGDGDREVRAATRSVAAIEVERACFADGDLEQALLERCRALARAMRRAHPTDDVDEGCMALRLAVTKLHHRPLDSAEVVLVRSEIHALAFALAEEQRGRSRVAGLRLLGELVTPADAPRLGLLLGDHDDDVRRGAHAALLRLGAAAIEAMLELARFGRRQLRDEASAVLRALPVSGEELDRLIASEVGMLNATLERVGAFASLANGRGVVQRLIERADEIGQTVLSLIEARYREPAVAKAAASLRRAQTSVDRARALEALDASLPRQLATRLVAALDGGMPTDRCATALSRAAEASNAVTPPLTEELGGDDPITRDFVLHALGQDGRAAHRAEITAAATTLASRQDPLALLQRLTLSVDDGTDKDANVPRSVETVMLLSRIGLFADLSTRQLTELAKVVEWREIQAGDRLDTVVDGAQRMWILARGSFAAGEGETSTLTAGDAFGESSLLAPAPAPAHIVAAAPGLAGAIRRTDLEELIDDVPGFALGICRALGRRLYTHTQN